MPEYSEDVKKREIYPLIAAEEVKEQIDNLVKRNDLSKHIRLNSKVERAADNGKRWKLTIREYRGDKDAWYEEEFDALISAVGHYSLPYIPVSSIEKKVLEVVYSNRSLFLDYLSSTKSFLE